MLYRELAPHIALRSFVECFWVWRTDSAHQWEQGERILPDGCTELLFDFGELTRQTGSYPQAPNKAGGELAGQLSSAFEFQPIGALDVLGVRFHAQGIFPFLDHPLTELTDRVVPLREIRSSLSKQLWPMLLQETDDRQRIRLVEQALLSLTSKNDLRPDSHLRNAVKCIEGNYGLISIDDLSREIGLGRRQLERKFALQVGITAKRYTRIVRFKRILSLVQRTNSYDWQSVAANCGYYDQSHLIREFKEFSGQTPSRLLGADRALSLIFQSDKRKTFFYNT